MKLKKLLATSMAVAMGVTMLAGCTLPDVGSLVNNGNDPATDPFGNMTSHSGNQDQMESQVRIQLFQHQLVNL